MSKDELIVRLVAENIELRDEIKQLKENSIPVKKIYAGSLSAIIMEVTNENRSN
jgi:hypothetical protein